MSHYRITKEEILLATNGGLDIIISYYPDAAECIGHKTKKFKMREEKTPSAAIKQATDGNYLVADFGDDGKWMNGIALCQKVEGLGFGEAIKFLAERYAIGGEAGVKSIFEPLITVTDADPEDKEGDRITGDFYEETPTEYLQILFSEKVISAIEFEHRITKEEKRQEEVWKKLRSVCTRLHWFALKDYSIIKNRKAIKISSTEYYPIFIIHEKDFQKIYQPKAKDKGHRFMYLGKFDPNFLHGHEQAINAYNELNAKAKKDIEKVADAEESEAVKLIKHPEILYLTGGSDALNAAALGYQVVWPSSEHYKLEPGTVKRFYAIAENVMTCPDMDTTGQKQNHRLCMDDRDDVFLDVKTITLPEELKLKRDFRGNPCKDLRDYFRFYTKKNFRGLVDTALPYRFWDIETKRNKDGDPIIKFGRQLQEFKPNNLRMYNFLMRNGFYRYKVDEDGELEFYIHIDGNIVRRIKVTELKDFIDQFFEKRHMGEDLRNSFYRSTQLSENSMSYLKYIDIDFTDYDKKEQFFYFEDATWRVTPGSVESFKPGAVNRFVWKDEVIPHQVKKLPQMFAIIRDEMTGIYDIEIKDESCLFFRYLINTSRIYWRKELEDNLKGLTEAEQEEYKQLHQFSIDGKNLTEEEKEEQKSHLINKIYALGYLLARYKDPSKPWAIFAMDNKISDDGLSHGGSGKSIAFKAIRYFMKSVTFDGRNNKLFDDKHAFERVNKHTDYMLFDDANRGFQFDRLFSVITGELVVNPKGKTQYELAFKDVPKLAVTSNFTPNEISPTVLRRLLFTVFGDYYHNENNGEYNESRGPRDDFGKNLFDDFDEKEWNLFCNFMAQCCQVFMNFDKIEPPMANVQIRNLQNFMGQAFLHWADVYFSEEADRRDAWIIKSVAMDDFVTQTKMTGWSTQAFTSRIIAWCRYKGLILNPKELLNKDERLVKTLPEYKWDGRERSWYKTGTKKTSEMLYLQTPLAAVTDRVIDPCVTDEAAAAPIAPAQLPAKPEDDELPF